MAANSSSSNASNSTKLQRRLMALPRKQWGLSADFELLSHLSTAHSLPDMAQLSCCLIKMAEHVRSLRRDERLDFLA
jgi:hypothetical protein